MLDMYMWNWDVTSCVHYFQRVQRIALVKTPTLDYPACK